MSFVYLNEVKLKEHLSAGYLYPRASERLSAKGVLELLHIMKPYERS